MNHQVVTFVSIADIQVHQLLVVAVHIAHIKNMSASLNIVVVIDVNFVGTQVHQQLVDRVQKVLMTNMNTFSFMIHF